jgi:hypothetical protein
MTHSKFRFQSALAAAAALVGLAIQSSMANGHEGDRDDDDRDGCTMTFSTVGDSRQDNVAPDSTALPVYGQDSIWLQSTKAWSRIQRSITEQKSDILFFNGDMIMGYGNDVLPANNTTVAGILGSDLVASYKQYAFWRGMAAGMMETGTYVVPVAGNHEVQWKAGGKKAQVANENAWRDNMADLILDDRRFKNILGDAPSNESVGDSRNIFDGLTSDQSKLSFSFDFKGAHFTVINTDPVGKDSHAPTNWLAADLYAARSRGAKHFFVFGHKPAFTYYYGSVIPTPPAVPLPGAPSGLDVDLPARDAFWDVIEMYGATYFCGHEHIFNMMQPRGKAWQVMVGSGGSPFEAKPGTPTVGATDRTYAWATVKVAGNDRVTIKAYGFSDAFGPTQLLKTVKLAR